MPNDFKHPTDTTPRRRAPASPLSMTAVMHTLAADHRAAFEAANAATEADAPALISASVDAFHAFRAAAADVWASPARSLDDLGARAVIGEHWHRDWTGRWMSGFPSGDAARADAELRAAVLACFEELHGDAAKFALPAA